MAYNAPNADAFRKRTGSLAKKITGEFGKIDTEIDLQKIHMVHLTAGLGTVTAQATTGVDLADGNDTTYYAVFVPMNDITILSMDYLLTEAYKKDTTDAKIELICPEQGVGGFTAVTATLPAGGAVADSGMSVLPVSAETADINAFKRLDLKVTATDSGGSGTGYAVVILKYINR
jgi:hypothetical protein